MTILHCNTQGYNNVINIVNLMFCCVEWRPKTCRIPSSTSPPAAAPLTMPSSSPSSVAACTESSSLHAVLSSSVESRLVHAERRVDVSYAVSVADAAVEVGASLLALGSQWQNTEVVVHSSSAVNPQCSTSAITSSFIIAASVQGRPECATSVAAAAANAVPSSNQWQNSEVTRSSSAVTFPSVTAALVVQSITPVICTTSTISLPSITAAASVQSNQESSTSTTTAAVRATVQDKELDSEERFCRQQTEQTNANEATDNITEFSPVPVCELSCDERNLCEVSGPLDNFAQAQTSPCTAKPMVRNQLNILLGSMCSSM